jgi:predicted transcriptional regulator
VTARLDSPATIRKLDQIARRRGVTRSTLVRQAVADVLEREAS